MNRSLREPLVDRQRVRAMRAWWATPAAFACTLFAFNANAGLAIPDDPLVTASRVAPNILFILDDSGSMAPDTGWVMDVPNFTITGPGGIANDDTGDNNDLTFDDGDGNRNIQKFSYTNNSVFYNPAQRYRPWIMADGNFMPDTPYSAAFADRSLASNPVDLGTVDRAFHVPKNSTVNATLAVNYYRYRFKSNGTADRCEWVDPPGSPSWQWTNCVAVTTFPDWDGTGPLAARTLAQEKANFANWFSFHRTRMKAAKAGAGNAFSQLGDNIRVGYDSIWNRNPLPIPVGRDNGLFRDVGSSTNRTDWYNHLYDAVGTGRTPLHSALARAGTYFQNSSASGPWGPETGSDQLTCRQNFSILTTDGYWNQNQSGTNQDNTNGTAHVPDPDLKPTPTYTQYVPATPFSDSHTGTLADMAMRYWKEDLRTDMANNVPYSTKDPAFWQHMVTFGISIGLSGTTGWTSVADVPANATWPDPMDAENADRIDDLLHAAVNGRGAFIAASNPTEFTSGLLAALADIQSRTSSFSNVATNSVSLDTGTQVFNASYVSGTWSGQLAATPVTASGVAATPAWTASFPAYATRRTKVFTSSSGSGASFPTTAQETALTRTGGPVNFPVTGADNAAYIMGDRSLERTNGGTLRNRTSVLGDIVGSSPAYVKDTNSLYVGANDGMLHAFDAATGSELFAYVPSIISFSNLSTLSRPDYAHRFFVDGPVAVSTRALTPNKNILVGSLGRGGKGLYSLDVTNPGSFSASDFNWELRDTHPTNGNMGLVLGKPLLSRVSTGVAAAVVSNGPNSTRERAVLIVVDLDTGAVIREIDTGVGSAATPNGLSAPVGVLGRDGKTLAYVYAGDLLGNVWKFDLTDPSPINWSVQRLFTAVNGAGNAQPITGGLTVAIHPRTFKTWVFFGTGRFLTAGDASSSNLDVQSMYGFEDKNVALTRSNLTMRTITIVDTAAGVRGFEPQDDLPTGSDGWYIDLLGAGGTPEGERIIQDAQIVSSILVTASMIPTYGACDPDGSGYINALDAFTGTSASVSYFDLNGRNGTGDEVIGSGSGQVPIGSVNLGNGMPTLPSLLRGLIVAGGTGGGGVSGTQTIQPDWYRVSWHEIRKD